MPRNDIWSNGHIRRTNDSVCIHVICYNLYNEERCEAEIDQIIHESEEILLRNRYLKMVSSWMPGSRVRWLGCRAEHSALKISDSSVEIPLIYYLYLYIYIITVNYFRYFRNMLIFFQCHCGPLNDKRTNESTANSHSHVARPTRGAIESDTVKNCWIADNASERASARYTRMLWPVQMVLPQAISCVVVDWESVRNHNNICTERRAKESEKKRSHVYNLFSHSSTARPSS